VKEKLEDGLMKVWRRGLDRVCLLVLSSLGVTLIMTSVVFEFIQPLSYVSGQTALHNLYSPREFLLEMEHERDGQRADRKRVFLFDNRTANMPANQLQQMFLSIQEFAGENAERGGKLELSQENILTFERQFGVALSEQEWDLLADTSLWSSVQSSVLEFVEPIVEKGIIGNKIALNKLLSKQQRAVLRPRAGGAEQPITSTDRLYDLREAQRALDVSMKGKSINRGDTFDRLIYKLASSLLKPNVLYDIRSSEIIHSGELSTAGPTYSRVRRGELLVRAGDVVTDLQEQKLERLHQLQTPKYLVRSWLGLFSVTAIVILCVYWFLGSFWPNCNFSNRDLGILALATLGTFMLIRGFSIVSNALGQSFDYINPSAFLLAAPVAAGGILLEVTLGPASVMFFTITCGLLSSFYLGPGFGSFAIMMLVGNFIGAIRVKVRPRRSSFIAAGIWVAVANVLVVAGFLALDPEVGNRHGFYELCFSAIGGLVAGILASGLTPVAEALGGFVTDIKLLELASLDRPLLRALSIEAPGTWNHSMVMGQLAEVASEAIGANGILARVGAYYHDIGKMKKPLYFVENQRTGENRHDRLTPSMSTLIIKSHVKDGLELAQQHKVPKAIADFIPQHHGTSLIEFFYEKAVRDAEDREVIDDASFRYPGPKPQTKEAGILMLADVIEAASRTIPDPSHAKIQGLVQKTINKIFASGQLDESNLTLRDLHIIAKSFTRVLNGIYHRRISYNEPAEKVREVVRSSRAEKIDIDVTQPHAPPFNPIPITGTPASDTIKPVLDIDTEATNAGRSPGEGNGGRRAAENTPKKGAPSENKEALKRLGM
jgi:cyclic-di-AMP phosphodiesterase PgpH